MKIFKQFLLIWLGLCIIIPVVAQADSITPETYSATIGVGESVTIQKRVTIDQDVTTAKVDVLFLFDTTGSMENTINAAKTNATGILTNTAGLGDVAFGVAQYQDFPYLPYGDSGDTPFQLLSGLTTDQGATTAGINALSLSSGYDGDTPESNLYALSQAAHDVMWRDDSTRIVVWFGDAPGHDTDNEPYYPGGVNVADTIAALNAENIIVEAVDVYPYSNASLDKFPILTTEPWGDINGQATAITTATGGNFFDGVATTDIEADIAAALEDAFASYKEVSLLVEGADNVSVSFSPAVLSGNYDRSTTNTFLFDVTFTGDAAGVDDIKIHALLDGGIVATEDDTITVTGGIPGAVPEPGTMLLFGMGLLGFAGLRRKQ